MRLTNRNRCTPHGTAFRPVGPRGVIFFLLATAISLPARTDDDFSLVISSSSARAGTVTDVFVTLDGDARPAALAFVLEYDAGMLFADPESVTLLAGSEFRLSVFALAPGRLGIVLYDPRPPISTLPAGDIVRLRFSILPGGAGFARVAIAADPPPNASDSSERLLRAGLPANRISGITITPLRPELLVSPLRLDFGSIPTETSVTKQIVLANIGEAPLAVERIHLDDEGAPFVLGPLPPLPLVLGAGESMAIDVSLAAEIEGSFAAHLVIEHDGSPPRSVTIPILATTTTGSGHVHSTRLVIPVVTRMKVTDSSLWRSTLTLHNDGAAPASIRLTFRPGTSDALLRELLVEPGHTRGHDDLLSELFELEGGIGPLLVEASSPDVVVRSAAVRDDGEEGTISQQIPTLQWSELLRSGERGVLTGLERSISKETRIALINFSSAAITLRLDVLLADGTSAGLVDYTVEGGEFVPMVDVFDRLDIDDAKNVTVVVTSRSPNATFFAYASTLDLRSGAPLFQPVR